MKKLTSVFLMLLCLVLVAAPVASADSISATTTLTDVDSYVTYYDDGSYTVTTVKQSPINSRASTYTTWGEKLVELYNSSDELQWVYTLRGTFSVTQGVSAVCTESTFSSVVYEDSWSLTAHNNYCSGNVAYGTATYKKKVLFITTNTHDIEASIGCDANGNMG